MITIRYKISITPWWFGLILSKVNIIAHSEIQTTTRNVSIYIVFDQDSFTSVFSQSFLIQASKKKKKKSLGQGCPEQN